MIQYWYGCEEVMNNTFTEQLDDKKFANIKNIVINIINGEGVQNGVEMIEDKNTLLDIYYLSAIAVISNEKNNYIRKAQLKSQGINIKGNKNNRIYNFDYDKYGLVQTRKIKEDIINFGSRFSLEEKAQVFKKYMGDIITKEVLDFI
jgi:hypothetical protein